MLSSARITFNKGKFNNIRQELTFFRLKEIINSTRKEVIDTQSTELRSNYEIKFRPCAN